MTTQYTDLDLDFTRHPGTGDVARIFNLSAIKNSMVNIINGKPFEKPFDEHYGTGIRGLLFTLYTPLTSIIIKKLITEKVELYEPRVSIIDVVVDSTSTNIDTNHLSLDIIYYVRDYGQQSLRIEMERLR